MHCINYTHTHTHIHTQRKLHAITAILTNGVCFDTSLSLMVSGKKLSISPSSRAQRRTHDAEAGCFCDEDDDDDDDDDSDDNDDDEDDDASDEENAPAASKKVRKPSWCTLSFALRSIVEHKLSESPMGLSMLPGMAVRSKVTPEAVLMSLAVKETSLTCEFGC